MLNESREVKRSSRLAQETVVRTRCINEGGSQPVGLVRFRKRAGRCRSVRLRREARRLLLAWSFGLMAGRRWASSVPQMHCLPVLPLRTNARPVVLLPGSIFRARGWETRPVSALRMMVKGARLNTAALPASRSVLARFGVQGIRGERLGIEDEHSVGHVDPMRVSAV